MKPGNYILQVSGICLGFQMLGFWVGGEDTFDLQECTWVIPAFFSLLGGYQPKF